MWVEILKTYRVAALMKCSVVLMVAIALSNMQSISDSLKDNIEKVLKLYNCRVKCEGNSL